MRVVIVIYIILLLIIFWLFDIPIFSCILDFVGVLFTSICAFNAHKEKKEKNNIKLWVLPPPPSNPSPKGVLDTTLIKIDCHWIVTRESLICFFITWMFCLMGSPVLHPDIQFLIYCARRIYGITFSIQSQDWKTK